MTTENDEFVYGNMFVYMRPVFHTNGSLRLDILDQTKNFDITASASKAIRGQTTMLSCPVVGYPKPDIVWYKDHVPLEASEKYQFTRNELYIRDVDDADEGIYRCIASNEFPPHIDYKDARYEANLDQQLRVTSSLSWLVPLIVIIIILIVLFVIIYTCAWMKRREAQRYDVAIHEKSLHNAEQQRLKDIEDE